MDACFLSLLFCSCNVVLIFETRCTGQTVSFTTSDEIILIGTKTSLMCSLSDTTADDNVTIVITDEMRNDITLGKLNGQTVYTQGSIPLNITTNRTFFCHVTWMNFQSTANLSISPLAKETVLCRTNYTDGIFIGQMITSKCYSSLKTAAFWTSENGTSVPDLDNIIRSSIFVHKLDTQPFLNQNGSVFTCARGGQLTDEDQCSVGPIYIYDELIVSIHPVIHNDRLVLHPGESNQYICSSFPNSSIEWITIPLELLGIEFLVVGSMINITVSSDTIFTGDIDLECVGSVLNHSSSAVITLTIIPKTVTDDKSPTVTNESEPSASLTDLDLHRVLSIALYVTIGCAGIIIIVLIILISVSWTPRTDKVRRREVSDARPDGGLKTARGGTANQESGTLEQVYTMVNTGRAPVQHSESVKYANFNGKKVVDNTEAKKGKLEEKASVTMPTYTTVNKFRNTIIDSDDFDDDFDDDAYWEY